MITSISWFDSEFAEMPTKIPIAVLPVLASGLTGLDVWKFLLNKTSQGG
jgi:hypothetical protein